MTSTEIKIDIHKKIDRLQDLKILNEIYLLLEKNNSTKDFWDDLTPSQKTDIEIGLNDLKAGKKKLYREVLAKYGL